ncbi:polysaccharide pyruvyl transferase family protein [Aureimonas altamirensis]|uniref:polysaccharide pyruvyl transferase family protein n=1 Tax=Aureimonas altamirensis TaxID=370622 RepID=UPI003015B71F
MPETNAAIIARLKGLIEDALVDLVDPTQAFALLDFPNHYNIGDSAIWMGELAYFDGRGMRAAYVSEIPTFDEGKMKAAVGNAPIFLHGGGNFGDVWPGFRPFREALLDRHKGRPIVQLPQTIKFNSEANRDSTARAIEKHGKFTLLVRDQRSLDYARAHFQCETRLVPDMAFCIGPVTPPAPTHELLLNLRDDHEATGTHDVSQAVKRPGTIQSDWPEEPEDFQRRTKRTAILRGLLSGQVGGRARMTELAYRERARQRFQRGIELLGSARQVITDRMHGHIMCVLIDRPHCVLDNSYGKTSGLISAWNTTNSDRSFLVADMAEALAVLDGMDQKKAADASILA